MIRCPAVRGHARRCRCFSTPPDLALRDTRCARRRPARGGKGLAAAGLDHFTGEWLPTDHPLVSMPNVVLTPHRRGPPGTPRPGRRGWSPTTWAHCCQRRRPARRPTRRCGLMNFVDDPESAVWRPPGHVASGPGRGPRKYLSRALGRQRGHHRLGRLRRDAAPRSGAQSTPAVRCCTPGLTGRRRPNKPTPGVLSRIRRHWRVIHSHPVAGDHVRRRP